MDWKKQRRISRTADYYRVKHRILEDVPCRFDVIAVTPDEITLYRDAFPYCGW